MADSVSVPGDLRGLVLSAHELRELTDWPEPLIEDYLAIIDGFQVLANVINVKEDILKEVTYVDPTSSPYEIPDTDRDVFFDTTSGDITANLRPGTDGRNYRLVNIATTGGHKVTLNPFGSENLFGENKAEFIYGQEALHITFFTSGGWN